MPGERQLSFPPWHGSQPCVLGWTGQSPEMQPELAVGDALPQQPCSRTGGQCREPEPCVSSSPGCVTGQGRAAGGVCPSRVFQGNLCVDGIRVSLGRAAALGGFPRGCVCPLLSGEAAGSVCMLSWASAPPFTFLIFQEALNSPGEYRQLL